MMTILPDVKAGDVDTKFGGPADLDFKGMSVLARQNKGLVDAMLIVAERC